MDSLEKKWAEYFNDLLEIVLRSRWIERCGRGSAEDVVQSAINSALNKEDFPPLNDQNKVYNFLKGHLERKINEYKKHYQTGDGRTLRMSQISSENEKLLFDLIECVREASPDDNFETPPKGFEGALSHEAVEKCMEWIRHISETYFNDRQRAVLELRLDGVNIEESARVLGISYYQARYDYRQVYKELQNRMT